MDTKEFVQFKHELNIGYQITFIYMDNKYLVFKTGDNCYTMKLLTIKEKNPHPIIQLITLKRLKEIFPFMEEKEYVV